MGDASEAKVLQCGVVGAGIAGLGAAVALRRAGHHVEVFERSQFNNEIGAAMLLTPNANLILDAWGLDADRACQTRNKQARIVGWDTGEVEYQDSLEGVEGRYGHVFNAFHRVDLHEALRDLALKDPAVAIKLGTEVKKIDCQAGVLTFADGVEVRKDLLVIADGIRSNLVGEITQRDMTNEATGKSNFRSLIPMDKLMADETIRPLFEHQPPGLMSSTRSPSGVLFITYLCRDDKMLNIAVFHSTREHQKDARDWNSPATVDDVLEVLEGFHPIWHAIVKKADTVKVYKVTHRDEISRLANGKAIVIGDAAHPMMPTHTQGASMALEDAASLEILLANVMSETDAQNRLRLFEQLRLPRCATTQVLSNGMFYPKDVDKQAIIRKHYQGPLLPPGPPARPWSAPIRDFFYSYDVFEQARKALEYKDSPAGVPEGVLEHFGRGMKDHGHGIKASPMC